MSDIPFLTPPHRLDLDALPIQETSLDALDLDRVAQHIAEANRRGRYNGQDDVLTYLHDHRCVVTVGANSYLTLTGVLCFGKNPQTLFPHAVVDLSHYSGEESISSQAYHVEKDIGGTLFDQMERVSTYLWQNTHHGMNLDPDSLRRVEIHEYPRPVLRELVINMLAHRDYGIYGSTSRVQLFRNRIEWASPGRLPAGMTVETILREQHRRNPNITRILYQSGLAEALGQGLDTVVATLRSEGIQPPEFYDTGASFIVTVFGRDYRTTTATDTALQEKYNLTHNQLLIYQYIQRKGEVSPRELRTLFEDRSERGLQRDLKAMVEANLLTTHGGSRALRYRIAKQSRR